MNKRVKRVFRSVLFRLPWGKQFYVSVYTPLVARVRGHRHSMEKVGEEMADRRSLIGFHHVQGENVSRGECAEVIGGKEALTKVLALQDEWVRLLQETVAHIDFLHKFVTPMNGNEQETRAVIEELRRHLQSLNIVFRSLLARQETQVQLAQALVEGHHGPSYEGRARRLEKVIEYLVSIQGDDPPP